MQADSPTVNQLVRYASWLAASVFILLPFHAFFTTMLGATFEHLDLFRIWKELLLVPLVLVSLYLAFRRPSLREWLKHDLIVQLIVIYLALHILRGLGALNTENVTPEALIYGLLANLRFLAFFGVTAILTAYSPFLKTHWRKLVLWPALGVVVFGLLQHFVLPRNFLSHFGYGPETIPAYQTVDQKPGYVRIQSTLRGPNPLGAYLVVIITLLLSLGLTSKRRRIIVAAAATAATVVLVFTYSRSAAVGLVVALAIIGWQFHARLIKRSGLVIVLTTLVVVVAAGTWLLRDNNHIQNIVFHTDETSLSPQSSNEVRGQSLINGAKDIIEHPLGQGPGTAGPASTRNNGRARISENYYLQIGQEVGVLGLLTFVGIVILVGARLWQRRTETLALVLFASLIGLSVVNMVSHAWADDTLGLLWWGLAGIALAPGILKQKRHDKPQKTST